MNTFHQKYVSQIGVLLRFLGTVGGIAIAPAISRADTTLHLPPTAKAPTIDGALSPGEWDGAFQGCGLIRGAAPTVLERRQARYWLTYDGAKIYFAIQTEMPPWGKLDGKRRRVADEAAGDDAVSLFAVPARPANSTDETYFQILGNWAGTLAQYVLDRRASGQVALGAPIQFASATDDKWWTAEFAIPAAGLKNAQLIDGQTWAFNVARSWHNPQVPTAWPAATELLTHNTFLKLTLDKTAPVVQLRGLGDPQGGKPGFAFSLFNPGGQELRLSVNMRVTDRSTGKEMKETRPVTLAARGRQEIAWQTPWTRGKSNYLEAAVASADNAVTYFQEAIPFDQDNGRETAWVIPSSGAGAVEAKVCFYPGVSRLRCLLNFSTLRFAPMVNKVVATVKDPTGKQIATETEEKFAGGETEFAVQLPRELAEGQYTATLSVQAGNKPLAEPVTKTFLKKKFPFENNTIGISDKVLFPWTPMKVQQRVVNCWNRDLQLGANGLFQQVKSGKHNLLARPVEFVCKSGGAALPWKDRGVTFTKNAPHAVDFTAASTCAKANIEVSCHSEFDGMFKYTVTLRPNGDGQVDGLDLVVPLKEENAWLLHATSDGCRTNASLFTPAGEGRVWDSTQVKQWRLTGTFTPYIWLGDDRVGLCWWADAERGWVRPVDTKIPVVEVRREKGEVQMVFHIIARPFQLKEPRTLVFAMTPTPVRPRPQWARSWTMQSAKSEGYLKGPHIVQLGSTGWTTFDNERMPEYPYTYARIRPVSDEADAFLKSGKSYVGRVKAAGGVPVVYTDLITRSVDRDEEVKYYASEWDRTNTPHPIEETKSWGSDGGVYANMCRSRIDYDLWCMKHDADLGVDGFYFDETQSVGQLNPTTGYGFPLDDGSIENESSLFEMREYFKRVYTFLQEMGHQEPFLMPHTSGNMYAGPFAFVTLPMDLEMVSSDPDPDRGQIFGIGEPYALCNVMAYQHGFAGSGMYCAPDSHAANVPQSRTLLGSMLLLDSHLIHGPVRTEGALMDHALGVFGYDQPGVEYVPYWRANDLQTTGPERVHVSLFRNKDKALLVMYNDSPKTVAATWKPTAKFGFQGETISLLDAKEIQKTPTPLQTRNADGSWTVEIPRYDYRLVMVGTSGTWGKVDNWGPVDPELLKRNMKAAK